MSNKYIILELLKVDKLTVKEIVDKTEFKENDVRTYIHRLLKDNLIKQIGKKDRYCLYEAVENDPIEFLKFMNDFFKDNVDYLSKNPKIKEYVLKHDEFDKIEAMVK